MHHLQVTALPAVFVPAVVVLAPAPAQEAEQPLVPLLGGAATAQAPDAAPAPAPTPIIECSDSGSNNRMFSTDRRTDHLIPDLLVSRNSVMLGCCLLSQGAASTDSHIIDAL